MLPQRELNGGLARCNTFRWKTQSASAPCKAHFQRPSSIRLEKHPAVRVRYRNGMIEHRTKHGIERKLRVKKRRGFEQQIEFAQAAAHWLRAGDVLDACEQIRKRLLAARRA